MSISGVSSSTSASILQQLITDQNERAGSAESSESQSEESRQAGFLSQIKQAALNAGLDSSKIDDFESDVLAAISQSEENGQGNQDAVKNAIDGVLSDYDVDVEAFQSEMQAQMGQGKNGPPPPPQGGGMPSDMNSAVVEAALASGLDESQSESLEADILSAITEAMRDADESEDPRQTAQSAINEVLEDYGVDLSDFESQMASMMGGS